MLSTVNAELSSRAQEEGAAKRDEAHRVKLRCDHLEEKISAVRSTVGRGGGEGGLLAC